MQGNIAELIRELMDVQQLSVRKVSARIAEKHGGSVYGYTQQISRILNDPTYDPTLSTVQKILSALNVSFWQVSQPSEVQQTSDWHQLTTRLDQISADVADLKLGLTEVRSVLEQMARYLPLPQSESFE
ncbi:MAG TPA: helix-turn-helix transcriptional regulator [Crinalium sp.]|jgi:transcriptional regulator with XRE-family HTH domain